MNYKELIEHIMGNAIVYMKEFKNKQIDEQSKGMLRGFWMDMDSIKNQLEIEKHRGNAKEVSNIEKELKIESILEDLQGMINN